MPNHLYFEDAFVEFYSHVMYGKIPLQYQDQHPCDNFYNLITDKKQLTENQGRFIVKILEKYKKFSSNLGLRYQHLLDNPKWKNTFRIIDTSKKIFIENDDQNNLWINAKFPYALKDIFQKEIVDPSGLTGSHWDPESKVRRIPFRNCNIIHIYEFAIKHGFEVDDSVLTAMSEVEEIWNNAHDVVPYSKIIDDKVYLINANEDVEAWWSENSTGTIQQDMFLAKTAGFPLQIEEQDHSDILERISTSEETHFWIKDNDQFFNLYNTLGGKCAVVLDRNCDVKEWIGDFVNSAEKNQINRNLIKVCFRESQEDKSGFNDWIKQNNLGGTLENADIFIFQHKPPKWLFKDNISVKIVVTNGLYPSTSNLTQALTESHPCVIHLGNIKPSAQRKITIVDL